MNREEFFQFHREFLDDLHAITQKKNTDYTGAMGHDPFANFTRVEMLGIATTEQGFLTRMTDKLCRVASFVSSGQLLVKDESVIDTLKDLANYCALFAGFLESQKRITGGE